ncbi:G5 domain-containing protein [Demequina zhanjiangensis]|uniref:G5 domain-containing protein n=1 Tax=Demequina zhanjiangensis TaxID=3051659 RepID=A0ABT8G4Y2_9MICO|nr:G5 domain-containing protein [Demequina sp. SYSU T00b26]MDN4474201.1 G5 domain-containing protein [Demequina sp. SYSU T00b26]
MRQLGVSAALIAFAAGSFTSTTVDALTTVRQDAGATTTLEVIGPVDAGESQVEVVTETEEVSLPHGTVTESDPSAMKGEEKVVTQGEAGTSLVSYEVTYVNGEEVSRVETVSVVVDQPVDEVVSVGTLVVPVATSNPTGNRAIGKELAESMYGWTDGQWQCLEALWTRESGWSHTAHNSSSGAHGIPQALPGSKMASAGADWYSNPATQIKWGLGYVKNRYGSPCNAWGHFTSVGWY